MAAPIVKIKLKNFKAFYGEEEVIDLGGKHLLMYGENGSGKSSIYWALYTLLQSATKSTDDIQKYFDPQKDEHLINYFFVEDNRVPDTDGSLIAPQSIGLNAYISIELGDGSFLRIDSRGIAPGANINALDELNTKSDFVSHRLLINFYNFRNSKAINLWEVFVRDVFPFVKDQNGLGNNTLSQLLDKINSDKPFKLNINDQSFSLTKSQNWQSDFNNLISDFNNEVEYWIDELNQRISSLYNDSLRQEGFEKLRITLDYSTPLIFNKYTPQHYVKDNIEYERYSNLCDLNSPEISLNIEIENEDGSYTKVLKPQSSLNEARLTAVALAVRFSLLHDSIRTPDPGKILVLDDLLVSLDMGNREKVVDLILDEYSEKYKVLWFTHEKNFFDFVDFKLRQKGKKGRWNISEIHQAVNERSNPIIIDSGLDYFEKSTKYYEAKDFTTCSIYLRKVLEKIVKERIPEEKSRTLDGQYFPLEHFWKIFKEKYNAFGQPITAELSKIFDQSKLLILNPQAHYSRMELPVYKVEIDKIFYLIKEIEDNYPIPTITLLLAEGMELEFTHPTDNYSLKCELKNDFTINTINGVTQPLSPRCKVLTWQYNNVEFWDFDENGPKKNENIVMTLSQIIQTIVDRVPLGITKELIIENTKIVNGLWTLKDLFDKAGVTI